MHAAQERVDTRMDSPKNEVLQQVPSRRTHRARRTRRGASRARLRTDATPDALLAA
jgi:hypothetical protein